MNEFDIIEKYFAPLTRGQDGAAGLRDDAAVLSVPDGYELVVTSDTLNEGVHFLPGEAPENIAKKALRVNLSDLAAMGAEPLCYQLNLAFPEKPSEDWLAAFSKALQEDNLAFKVFCSGGDTTSIDGAFSVSITAMGVVPKGKAVKRSGAQDGDVLILTGAVGDAVLGLKALREGVEDYPEAVQRYRVPCPRVSVAEIIREHANAAIDISDGLLADAEHIGRTSGLGVEINVDNLVYSSDVQKALDQSFITRETLLAGGDNYELILAVSATSEREVIQLLQKVDLKPIVIGRLESNALGLSILSSSPFRIDDKKLGWKHF